MDRRRAIMAAVLILALGLIFALIFGRSDCASDLTVRIGRLFEQLGGIEECEDGIDNDGDGYADSNGGDDGEPEDEKCLALNEPRESDNLALRSAAVVSEEGGLLVLGDLRINIPPGVLTRNTEIIMERIPGISAEVLSYKDVYDIKPDGLTFGEPVIITFRIRPDDPHLPAKPWIFTETPSGEDVLLDHIGYINFEDVHFMMGAIDHLSKQGQTTWEEFKIKSNARGVPGDCFVMYRETSCPDADLCHGGLRGNVHCDTCIIIPGGNFCCVCPADFPDSDFPCRDQNNNPIRLSMDTGCVHWKFPVQSDSCDQIQSRLVEGQDGERKFGRAFSDFQIPPSNVQITNRRTVGDQKCGTPTVSNVRVQTNIDAAYADWSGASSCQAEWDRFMAGLREHERGHAEIAKREGNRLQGEIDAMIWPEICASSEQKLKDDAIRRVRADLRKKLDEAEERQRKADIGYDRETNNGATQGAILNCNDCR